MMVVDSLDFNYLVSSVIMRSELFSCT